MPRKKKRKGRKSIASRSVVIDGITFPSTLEGKRYLQLKSKEKKNQISELSTQPRFTFERHGITIRHLRSSTIRHYTADFKYLENGEWVIEEVKGRMMKEASLRISIFKALYPEYTFRIIKKKDVEEESQGRSRSNNKGKVR